MKIKFLVPVVLLQTAMVMAWPFELLMDEDSLLGLVGAAQIQGGNTVVALAGAFEDPELLFLDSTGTLVRSISILERGGGSRAFESGGILVPVEDGIAAAFHSEPRATGIDTDVAVVRVSGTGEIIWTYILGLDDQLNWMCTDMILCSDGGLLVTGCPGTMLPAGFVFKLSSSGELEWITPPDGIDGFLFAAVELPDGSFIGLADDFSEELTLQRISSEGEILVPIRLDAEGVSYRGIGIVNGTVWITSDIQDGKVEWFRLDDQFYPDGQFSVEFQEEASIRCVDLDKEGLLAAGELFGDGLITCVGLEGGLIQQELFDFGEDESFSGAFRLEGGFGGYGTAVGPEDSSFSAVVQVWDQADE